MLQNGHYEIDYTSAGGIQRVEYVYRARELATRINFILAVAGNVISGIREVETGCPYVKGTYVPESEQSNA